MNNAPTICAVILAGGRGSRLGGVDKGLLRFEGEPLAARLVSQLATQSDEILISANRNQHHYRAWAKVVADHDPTHQGPLAGMQAALQATTAQWICTLPCDSPTIPRDYVQRMLTAATRARLVLAHDGESLQPVHALIHRSLASSLDRYLAEGGAKVRAWAKATGFETADFAADASLFRNANTPEDAHSMRLK